MPQASGIQGLHSIFEKPVSPTDDKGAFTVGKDIPRGRGGAGLPGRLSTNFADGLLFFHVSGLEQVPMQLPALGDTRRPR